MYLSLQGLREAALFAPLLGGHNEDERKRYSKAIIENIKNESVLGFSLLGLHTNGATAEKLDSKLISNLVKVSLVSISLIFYVSEVIGFLYIYLDFMQNIFLLMLLFTHIPVYIQTPFEDFDYNVMKREDFISIPKAVTFQR